MEPSVTAHAAPVTTDTFAANNSTVNNNQLIQDKEKEKEVVDQFQFSVRPLVRPEIFFGPDDSCHTHGVRQCVAAVATTKHCAGGLLIC
jgi:hypothetical protein